MEEINEYKKKESTSMSEMFKLRTETEEKYSKILSETEIKMTEFKRKYDA